MYTYKITKYMKPKKTPYNQHNLNITNITYPKMNHRVRKKLNKNKFPVIKIESYLYPITNKVLIDMNYKIIINNYDNDSWNILWSKRRIKAKKISKLKNHQCINSFPGLEEICCKNLLIKNIEHMKKKNFNRYNFIPKSWCLPKDLSNFMKNKSINNKTYIIKPNNNSCASGIIITQNKQMAKNFGSGIVQLYVDKPYLINGYKFDLRLYVFVRSLNPLKIFLYNDGLVRMCTEKYQKPVTKNLHDKYKHFTNTSINKKNKSFIEKNSRTYVKNFNYMNKYLQKKGHDVPTVWKNIKNVCVDTVKSILPLLRKNYREGTENDADKQKNNYICFTILGFDIILDSKLKPWLLEVNMCPSFIHNNAMDYKIKYNLQKETIQMLGISRNKKTDYNKYHDRIEKKYIKNYERIC